MTTLRNFQTEIDEIRAREVAKQRTHMPTTEKENKLSTASKGKVKEPTQHKAPEPIPDTFEDSVLSDQILTLLSNSDTTSFEKAKDLISTLITQRHGEFVIHIGLFPSSAKLYLNQLSEVEEDWIGKSRTKEEIQNLRQQVERAVDEIGGKVSLLFESDSQNRPRLALLLRLPPLDVSLTPEVRCAVVGNVDSGKSTTLGVLTRGQLDDGRGRARVWLFRHKHEVESGRTSSVGMEILGFHTSGAPILPLNTNKPNEPDAARHEKMGWEEISLQAAKIVSFSDLAGHERYLKTTLYGLTSGAPSCIVLVVGANSGLIGMSKEHLAIALALNVPVIVFITKIDMTPPNILAETIKQVEKILKSPGCRKTPVFVKSSEVAVRLSTTFGQEKLCPIFQISNVTGEGLDYVRTFLNLLPASESDKAKFAPDEPFEFAVTEIWSVPYVGTVVNGIVNAGTVHIGDTVLLGPDFNGNYQSTTVKDMQRKRATVKSAEAGQCVSLALKRVKRADVRKGMVLLNKSDNPPKAVRRFEGQVLILYHNTTLQKNYQAMLHCGAVRQTVRIVEMDKEEGILRTGDRATVQFEFISRPEHIHTGMKLLFREGKTKGLGVITRLL